MKDELEKFILGKRLGSGVHREVYEYNLNPKEYVVKVGRDEGGRLANLKEWMIWDEVRERPEIKKWLAQVFDISVGGKYLLMARAELGRKSDYPKKIPHFFMDTKYKNYGWIKGKLVCLDYASAAITNGFGSKMKKADWWEE